VMSREIAGGLAQCISILFDEQIVSDLFDFSFRYCKWKLNYSELCMIAKAPIQV
jgi:hypothetical protein